MRYYIYCFLCMTFLPLISFRKERYSIIYLCLLLGAWLVRAFFRCKNDIPKGVFTVIFIGTEIQPKHLVFYFLGFLPGFSLVFCFFRHLYSMHGHCTVISKKPRILFPCFLKTKHQLDFLEAVYNWNKDQIGIFCCFILIKVAISK